MVLIQKPAVVGQKPETGLRGPWSRGPEGGSSRSEARGSKSEAGSNGAEAGGSRSEAGSTGQKPGAAATKPDPDVATPEAVPPAAAHRDRDASDTHLRDSRPVAIADGRVRRRRGSSFRSGRRSRRRRRLRRRCRPRRRSWSTGRRRWPKSGMPPLSFNVYRHGRGGGCADQSVAGCRREVRDWDGGVREGAVLRRADRPDVRGVTLESAPSAPACLTPLDKFPPAAPKGLRAIAEDAAVSLVWEQNSEGTSADTWCCVATRLVTHCCRSRSSRSRTRTTATPRSSPGYDTSTPWSPWTRPRRGTRARRPREKK